MGVLTRGAHTGRTLSKRPRARLRYGDKSRLLNPLCQGPKETAAPALPGMRLSHHGEPAISRAGNNHFLAEHLKLIRNCVYGRPGRADAPVAGSGSGVRGVIRGARDGPCGHGVAQGTLLVLSGSCMARESPHFPWDVPWGEQMLWGHHGLIIWEELGVVGWVSAVGSGGLKWGDLGLKGNVGVLGPWG